MLFFCSSRSKTYQSEDELARFLNDMNEVGFGFLNMDRLQVELYSNCLAGLWSFLGACLEFLAYVESMN